MTKVKIINETVTYYSEDVSRRGMDKEGSCLYLTPTGTMCAVGRCLKDPAEFQQLSKDLDWGSIDSLVRIGGVKLDEHLKDEYLGHSTQFWQDLQGLHDSDSYWDTSENTGLSQDGEEYVQRLKNRYNEEVK